MLIEAYNPDYPFLNGKVKRENDGGDEKIFFDGFGHEDVDRGSEGSRKANNLRYGRVALGVEDTRNGGLGHA